MKKKVISYDNFRKSRCDDDVLLDNLWKIEYNDFIDLLNEKRLKFIETGLGELDDLNDYTRNWGEINGQLASDYFTLLQELKLSKNNLYEKYRSRAIEILDWFDFTDITVSQYFELKETGTIEQFRHFIDKHKE